MLETEKQSNTPSEMSQKNDLGSGQKIEQANFVPGITVNQKLMPKNPKPLKILFYGFILILVITTIFISYNKLAGKKNINQNQNTNSQNTSGAKGKFYTKEEADARLAELRFAQSSKPLIPLTSVLPDNFPTEYIPVQYEKLISVAGTPNTENKPYGATFGVSGTVEEKYNEVKKYFLNKNWVFTELPNRTIPNQGKQIVAQIKDVTIIATVSNENASTVVNLNIISQSNAK